MATRISRFKALIQSLPVISDQALGRELAIQYYEHYRSETHPIGIFEQVARLNHLGQVTFLVTLIGSKPNSAFMHYTLTCPQLTKLWNALADETTHIDEVFVRKAVQFIDKRPRPF